MAAALAYGVDRKQNGLILIYDLGGATFDVTLLNNRAGEMNILAIGGGRQLGGNDWDEAIVNHLALNFETETGTPSHILLDDPATYQELLNEAERSKKVLSRRKETSVTVRFGGKRVRVNITRETFEIITSQFLEATLRITDEVLRKAREKGCNSLDKLLLVGGSTYMPQVINAVKGRFSCEVLQFEPDLAIARGAALFAASDRREENLRLQRNRRSAK